MHGNHKMGGKPMKTLLVFSTKYGATKEIVQSLKTLLSGDVERIDLSVQQRIDISIYDRIIIASPIYAGSVPKNVKTFIKDYEKVILTKPLGICFSCMVENQEKVMEYAEKNLGSSITKHASMIVSLGGKFQLEKMSWLEKTMIKIITKNQVSKNGKTMKLSELKTYSTIKQEKIETFADEMNQL